MGEERYWAFISYSHHDARAAAWLQRAIETYRPPSRLGAPGGAPVPRRLTPIFRDREDLPAAGNLSDAIRAALDDSRFLIVVCSPKAAASRWVDEEIRHFKRRHGDHRVLALIVDGIPFASDDPARADGECFPPALRAAVDANGALTAQRVEPLAADLRPSADGRRLARLKIVAGMLGVRLDALIQRDAARRAGRQRMAVGASFALVGVLGAFAWRAELARRDADLQRNEAENLIEFMLTDLRDRLEPVGRLDVLEAVGARALDYYGRQEPRALDADSLNRRADALMLLGNIDQRRGDLAAAEASFAAALATTAEQLRREPDNPQRIFDHAQAVFYVGDVARDKGDLETTEARMRDYYELAQRLVAIDPAKPEWRLELAYGNANLGALKQDAGAYDEAAEYFAASAAARRSLSEADPADAGLAKAYASALSWQALADLSRGAFAEAIAALNEQIAIYDRLLVESPDDYSVFRDLVTAQRRLGEAYLCVGDIPSAAIVIAAGRRIVDQLLVRDASVLEWRSFARFALTQEALLLRLADDKDAADAALAQAISYVAIEESLEPPSRIARSSLADALAERLRYMGPEDSEAREIAAELEALLTVAIDEATAQDARRDAPRIADWALALALHASGRGDRQAALAYAQRGVAALTARAGGLSVMQRVTLAELRLERCEIEAAQAIVAELEALGLRHPSFIELKQKIENHKNKAACLPPEQ